MCRDTLQFDGGGHGRIGKIALRAAFFDVARVVQ